MIYREFPKLALRWGSFVIELGKWSVTVRRRTWLVMSICVATGIIALWSGLYEPWKQHRDFCRATRAKLATLAKKRPAGLTRKQWNNVVGWTIQAHGNTLVPTLWIPRADMRRFEVELNKRLEGQVDLATIDWIWDQFELLAPRFGPEYSRKYRPTSVEKLREFERDDVIWPIVEAD